MSKRDELTELAARLMELYPHLDGVIVEGTVDNPERIVFMSQEEMLKIAEEIDMDVEELYEEDEDGLIEFFFGEDDPDDDGNGGMLQ